MRHVSNIWALHLILQRWFIYVDFSNNQWFVGEKQDTEDVISQLGPHLTGKLFKDSKLYPPQIQHRTWKNDGFQVRNLLFQMTSLERFHVEFQGCISKITWVSGGRGWKADGAATGGVSVLWIQLLTLLKWHKKPTSNPWNLVGGNGDKHHIKLLHGFLCHTANYSPSKTKMSFGKITASDWKTIRFLLKRPPVFRGYVWSTPHQETVTNAG